MPRSKAAASRLASAVALLAFGLAGGSVGREARAAVAARWRASLVARLGEDIYLVSLLHDLVLFQFHAPVADAFAGLHIVFHAVPGADKVHLAVREEQPHGGLVRAKPLLDFGNGKPFAGRPALMQAKITVGVELALVPKHADLVVADKNDPALSIL